jgi:phosphatase and actin regulator 3
VTDKQIQEEREEKKRYLLRKLSFRPSVDELKNRKVIKIIPILAIIYYC